MYDNRIFKFEMDDRCGSSCRQNSWGAPVGEKFCCHFDNNSDLVKLHHLCLTGSQFTIHKFLDDTHHQIIIMNVTRKLGAEVLHK